MKLGVISSKVVLDRQHYVYSGNSTPVTGMVLLNFNPGKKNTTDELFGPLKVQICFWGRAKSKVTVSRGQSGSQSYSGRASLFRITQVVHDGPFTATSTQPFEVPFIVEFPGATEPSMHSRAPFQQISRWGSSANWRNSSWEPSTAWESEPGHLLPPSMVSSDGGFGHNFDAIVEYKISANITVPGIDVDVSDPLDCSVRYSPYSTMQAVDYSQTLRVNRRHIVHTKMLMPEDERPSGFRQKTKAALSSNSYPKLPFNVTLTLPQNLSIGTQPCLTVKIDPLLEDEVCTMQYAPDIELLDYSFKIKGITAVRAEKSIFNEHTDSGSTTLYKHEMIMPPESKKPVNVAPAREPIKLCASNGWTVKLGFKSIENLVPTFKTYNIQRTYLPMAKVVLRCAGEKFETEATFRQCILHPFERAESGDMNDQPGPSRATNNGEMLPEYEGLDLPSYEGSSNTTLLKRAPAEPGPGLPGKRG